LGGVGEVVGDGIIFAVVVGAGVEADSLTGGTSSPDNKSFCDMFANHSWLE